MTRYCTSIAALLLTFLLMVSNAFAEVTASNTSWKNTKYNNPISSEFFCADPTAVEYNGRLYVYGTNDHQQFEIVGPEKDNSYEKIKGFVVYSTDDMVNWTYHGVINVGAIAPWIVNSWAPSIVSRVEEDGLTHFYLYFSNNGLGVGVITSTDPVGPWTDPLGRPLISTNTPGLTDCPNPFDPGAVIDEYGVGYLAFGGGKASDGTDYMPGSTRIVRLGADMLSFDSEFAEIPAPYFFEASELNYIGGTYVYTYNTDWADHTVRWEYDCNAPTACSMVYMTTKTPLDPASWVMRGEYFKNPGLSGLDYSNNHTHLHKYQGRYYIFYHALELKRGMGIKGSYRSLAVEPIAVDEATVTITRTGGTRKGIVYPLPVDAFAKHTAAQLNNTADVTVDVTDPHAPWVISDAPGGWFSVRAVQFSEAAQPQQAAEPVWLPANVDTITYRIRVTAVDKPTTLTMYPAPKNDADHVGSAEITAPGTYTVTCDLGGAAQMMNMGYFSVSNDAMITLVLEDMTINGRYTFDISSELTNTREWANGLKNIWNGFADGDVVYTADDAEFYYSKADDAILLRVTEQSVAQADAAAQPTASAVFTARVCGSSFIEVRLDAPDGAVLTQLPVSSPDAFQTISVEVAGLPTGTHDLYFVFSDAGVAMDVWRFSAVGE